MTASPTAGTCTSCGAALRPNAVYCRECGATNANAPVLNRPAAYAPGQNATQVTTFAQPPSPQRPSIAHADRTTARRPRWFLGTFWALVTVGALYAGIVGPAKWLILAAVATGAYSVYLFRGGRYGWFFF